MVRGPVFFLRPLGHCHLHFAMLRVDLHNKVSSYLTDRRLLGDLRTTGACYTDEGVAEPNDDPNPSFCVRHGPLGTPIFMESVPMIL